MGHFSVEIYAPPGSDLSGNLQAVREALLAGVTSDDVILNILARRREPPRPLVIVTPEDLALRHPPRADCHRYDSLRGLHAAA